MSKIISSILLLSLSLNASSVWGAAELGAELSRLKGFAEHQNRQERFEKAREKGETEYFEEQDQWERQKERALADYKKTKKQSVMSDDGPEARADATAKKKQAEEYLIAEEKFLKSRSQQSAKIKRGGDIPTEEVELDVMSDRPRYDFKKRADYGGTPKYGAKAGAGSGGGGFSRGGGGVPVGRGSGNGMPAPPRYDDFEPEIDQPVIEDFGDIPPPPPPLPPGFEDGAGESDFPPPPPPPMFDGSGDF